MRRQEWGAANAPCAQTNRGKCAANLGEADGVGVWEGVEDLLVVEVVLDVESVPHDEVEDEQRQAHLQGRGIMAFFSGQRFKGDANRGGHQERDVGLREDASLSPMEWEDDGASLLTSWWGAMESSWGAHRALLCCFGRHPCSICGHNQQCRRQRDICARGPTWKPPNDPAHQRL